jgi:hypothetical protein
VDVANRLNPTLQATLAQYAGLIARSGGAGSNPSLGAVQLLQAAVIAASSRYRIAFDAPKDGRIMACE